MNTHLDALEKRAPAEREAALLAALPAQIAHAQKNAPAFAESLKGINAANITTPTICPSSLASLHRLASLDAEPTSPSLAL
jgi:hypothetical protein